MKMQDAAAPMPPPPMLASAEVFKQIGAITRLLHDSLQQLGVVPELQRASVGLPDARSRLGYIAQKTAAAAHKVLNSVDQAKAEHNAIHQATRDMAAAIAANPVAAVASATVLQFVGEMDERTARIGSHLTDIMLAQDFHDLTGQVVATVVSLANELENSLIKLLVSAVPPGQREKPGHSALGGPLVNAQDRTDVVNNQGEVDELLATLGF